MLQNELKANLYLKQTKSRYFVPDLSPQARGELKAVQIRYIFVGESPHVSEVQPEQLEQRRPLCGMAGKQWWSLLSELLEGSANPDVSLNRQIKLCSTYKFAVMNAVQYPLDPKVAAVYSDADPVKNLGFGKLTGAYSFKKYKTNPKVEMAIASLRERLYHPSVHKASIHCLGNDSEWLVTRALNPQDAASRLGVKIPHPSAWWRKGGFFGRDAKEKLVKIFDQS